MATQEFQVYLSGGTVSLDAWRQAMEAEESDLPALSEAQSEAAHKVGMAEPEYARGVLAGEIGEQSQREKGRRLGEIINQILNRAGQGWKLESLVRKGADFVWIARLGTAGEAGEVAIPLDIADDVVDSEEPFSRGKLENLLTNGIEKFPRRRAS
jgi:hypothetical protein